MPSTRRSSSGTGSTRTARSCSSPGTPRATPPYEGRFVERLVAWWERMGGRQRLQLLFRPHPRDREWRERYAAAAGRGGIVVQEASYTDLDDLAALLQHLRRRRLAERRHYPP